MGMVACAGEIENKKQDIFCVIQSTHNNYLAYSLVHVASQNYSTVYIFFCEAHRQTNVTHILYNYTVYIIYTVQ